MPLKIPKFSSTPQSVNSPQSIIPIFFREMVPEDAPAIKFLCKDIWEGEDYIPKIIDIWLADLNATHIGVFLSSECDSEKLDDLVGFGRIRWYGNEMGWLEGGRIRPDFQKKGIGRRHIEHSIKIAHEKGVKSVAYDTWASRDNPDDKNIEQNHGSIALAKFFGFKQMDYVDFTMGDLKDIKFPNISDKAKDFHHVSKEEAFDIYKKLIHGEFLNQTWRYIPFSRSWFLKLTGNCEWVASSDNNAIIQVIHKDSIIGIEGPGKNEIDLIAYGESKTAFELIFAFIQKIKESEIEKASIEEEAGVKEIIKSEILEKLSIFSPAPITDLLIPYGFHFYNPEPSGVILFKKDFSL